MTLSLIVAMAENKVIGRDNQLPWHLPEDLAHFKQVTLGKPVIMGRKTFESIGEPLPGRRNIVLTRNTDFAKEGVTVAHSWEEALEVAQNEGGNEVFVIGGRDLFQKGLEVCQTVYLTLIDDEFEGDTFFPEVKWENHFTLQHEESGTSDSTGLGYQFLTYARNP